MTVRLIRYARNYPLWFYAVLGLGWAYGLTSLFRVGQGDDAGPSASGLVVTAGTVGLTHFLFRAVDDVRDLDYDRVQNPRRPLVTGAVRVLDLMLLFFCGMVVLLLVNAPRGTPVWGYAALCGWTCLVLAVEKWAQWPRPEQLLLQLFVNLPLQLLFGFYVFLGSGSAHGRTLGGLDLVAIAGFVLCVWHLEFARRLTREPAAHTRTYVRQLGVNGTAAVTLATAVGSCVAELAVAQPWLGGDRAWGWLLPAVLPFPAVAAVRFFKGAPRWPMSLAVLYVLTSFVAFGALGLPHLQ
ncbi:hypothetical protein ABZ595_10565 [Streptomyces rubradiris]|uniref:hypothetical protein n=1 Tax=Streptomyces rubradiris TaxID=285531 RepID=UPI0033DF2BA3